MIRNILFDIGVVLLDLDYAAAMKRIVPLCSAELAGDTKAFFAFVGRDPSIADYERGRMTFDEFFARFCSRTGFRGSRKEFEEIWQAVFRENRPMIDYGRRLAASYDVFFTSNAGDLHVPMVYDLFPSLRFCKDDAISCYLGELKPDRAFYEKALAKFGITADTCLFVDDRAENVEGARACGIVSVQYTSAQETIEAMERILKSETRNPKSEGNSKFE